jgi:hypothetical protein
MRRPSIQVFTCFSWLLIAAAGIAALWNYEGIPGSQGQTPLHWPAPEALPLDAQRATLLVFAHPKCPCSRASIGELNRLLSQCGDHLAPHVFFFAPADEPEDWAQSDLWKSAAAIPGVKVHLDRDGMLAKRFGAETSGHALLYDSRGALLFSGGITDSRGHSGDNTGESAIIALAGAQPTATRQTPVFGCSILNHGNEIPEQKTGACTN